MWVWYLIETVGILTLEYDCLLLSLSRSHNSLFLLPRLSHLAFGIKANLLLLLIHIFCACQ
jgi:hypothetical protein